MHQPNNCELRIANCELEKTLSSKRESKYPNMFNPAELMH